MASIWVQKNIKPKRFLLVIRPQSAFKKIALPSQPALAQSDARAGFPFPNHLSNV